MTTTAHTLNVEPHWPGLLRWLVAAAGEEMPAPHGTVVAAFITGGEDTALLAAVRIAGRDEIYWRETTEKGAKWHKYPATMEQMKQRAFCYRDWDGEREYREYDGGWRTYVRGEEVPE